MRFVRVKKVPSDLRKGEHVIVAPIFITEIEACKNKKPRNDAMTVHYLRELVATIGLKYMDETFDAMREVNIANYKGVPCENTEKTNEILISMFKQVAPKILGAYVAYHLKRRPNGTNLVYFLGDSAYNKVFLDAGFEEVLEKNLDVIRGDKPKKVVGKPAITNEEAIQLDNLV